MENDTKKKDTTKFVSFQKKYLKRYTFSKFKEEQMTMQFPCIHTCRQ